MKEITKAKIIYGIFTANAVSLMLCLLLLFVNLCFSQVRELGDCEYISCMYIVDLCLFICGLPGIIMVACFQEKLGRVIYLLNREKEEERKKRVKERGDWYKRKRKAERDEWRRKQREEEYMKKSRVKREKQQELLISLAVPRVHGETDFVYMAEGEIEGEVYPIQIEGQVV